MAYKIIASQCTVCGACEFERPNPAIRLKNDMYIIDPKKCTECDGHFDRPQLRGGLPGRKYLRARLAPLYQLGKESQ
jgi:ferredoxin